MFVVLYGMVFVVCVDRRLLSFRVLVVVSCLLFVIVLLLYVGCCVICLLLCGIV